MPVIGAAGGQLAFGNSPSAIAAILRGKEIWVCQKQILIGLAKKEPIRTLIACCKLSLSGLGFARKKRYNIIAISRNIIAPIRINRISGGKGRKRRQ